MSLSSRSAVTEPIARRRVMACTSRTASLLPTTHARPVAAVRRGGWNVVLAASDAEGPRRDILHTRSTRRALLLGTSAVSASLGRFASSPRTAVAEAGAEFASPEALKILNRQGEIAHTKEEWQKLLTADQYRVLREEATEMPFSSPLNNEKRAGAFVCTGCGSGLFSSTTKYNSGTGWPSFYQPLPGAVTEVPDFSIFFMPRTEVRCKKCQGHLGHVFDDGPEPTHLRYCMNGVALKFLPEV